MKAIVGSLGVIGATIGLLLVATVVHGYVLYHYWRWFVTPLGIPDISLSISMGLITFRQFVIAPIIHRFDTVTQREDQSPLSDFGVNNLLMPMAFLGIGYLIHRMTQ